MICPKCNGSDVKIIDSRPRAEFTRRRRVCGDCGNRFGTLEVPFMLETEDRVTRTANLFSEILNLQDRWRQIAREVVRGLLARQALDQIKGKDAA